MVKYCNRCEWLAILWRVLGGIARICIGLMVIMVFSTFIFNLPFRTR